MKYILDMKSESMRLVWIFLLYFLASFHQRASINGQSFRNVECGRFARFTDVIGALIHLAWQNFHCNQYSSIDRPLLDSIQIICWYCTNVDMICLVVGWEVRHVFSSNWTHGEESGCGLYSWIQQDIVSFGIREWVHFEGIRNWQGGNLLHFNERA